MPGGEASKAASKEGSVRELPGAVLFACTMNVVRSPMAAAAAPPSGSSTWWIEVCRGIADESCPHRFVAWDYNSEGKPPWIGK